MAGPNAETALIKLSDIFQHSSVKITRIYLGLRKEELLETYDMLEMKKEMPYDISFFLQFIQRRGEE